MSYSVDITDIDGDRVTLDEFTNDPDICAALSTSEICGVHLRPDQCLELAKGLIDCAANHGAIARAAELRAEYDCVLKLFGSGKGAVVPRTLVGPAEQYVHLRVGKGFATLAIDEAAEVVGASLCVPWEGGFSRPKGREIALTRLNVGRDVRKSCLAFVSWWGVFQLPDGELGFDRDQSARERAVAEFKRQLARTEGTTPPQWARGAEPRPYGLNRRQRAYLAGGCIVCGGEGREPDKLYAHAACWPVDNRKRPLTGDQTMCSPERARYIDEARRADDHERGVAK